MAHSKSRKTFSPLVSNATCESPPLRTADLTKRVQYPLAKTLLFYRQNTHVCFILSAILICATMLCEKTFLPFRLLPEDACQLSSHRWSFPPFFSQNSICLLTFPLQLEFSPTFPIQLEFSPSVCQLSSHRWSFPPFFSQNSICLLSFPLQLEFSPSENQFSSYRWSFPPFFSQNSICLLTIPLQLEFSPSENQFSSYSWSFPPISSQNSICYHLRFHLDILNSIRRFTRANILFLTLF